MEKLTVREYEVIKELIKQEKAVLKKDSSGIMTTSIKTLQNLENKLYRNSEQYDKDKAKTEADIKVLEMLLAI